MEERVDHLGIELAAAAALQFRQALGVGERLLVGAAARHGVVGVDHGHGAGHGGDGLAGEAVGVAVAVVALVMVPHGEHEVLGEEGADDVGAHDGVLAHLVPLLLVQAAGLEQHPVGDADLADVVQVRRLLERRKDVLLPAQLVTQHHRVGRDPGGVAERVVVLGVQRRAQGLQVAEVHALDLVVQLGVLDRQGELRADALEQVAVDGREGVGLGAAQVEDAEEAGLGRQRDDDSRSEALDRGRPGQGREVVGQAHDEHPFARDALDEPGLEVVERDADQRVGGGSRADHLPHLHPVEQEQSVLLERHQRAQLVDGRLHDLFEVEAGGRPRRDVVEQLRLARRLLLAREERRVVDGEGGGVADGRRRVQLGLRERPLRAALDQLHRADHPVLDDQREGRPALSSKPLLISCTAGVSRGSRSDPTTTGRFVSITSRVTAASARASRCPIHASSISPSLTRISVWRSSPSMMVISHSFTPTPRQRCRAVARSVACRSRLLVSSRADSLTSAMRRRLSSSSR